MLAQDGATCERGRRINSGPISISLVFSRWIAIAIRCTDAIRSRIRCRRMRRSSLIPGAIAAMATALWVGVARADPPPIPRTVKLEYVRGPGAQSCPSEDTLRFAIAGRMAEKPWDPNASARLVVTIRRKGDLLEGLAEIRDAGDQVLWSFSTALGECHLVMDALAIAIGLVLDPIKPAAPAPSEPSAQPAPPEIESPTSTPVKENPPKARPPVRFAPSIEEQPSQAELPPGMELGSPPAPEDRKIRGVGGVGAALALRTAPAPVAFELMAAVGMRWRWFSLEGELRYSPPASADAVDVPGAKVSTSRLTGGLVPCGHVKVFFGCALVQAGAMFGSSSGVLMPVSASSPIVAGGARIGLDLPIAGRFSVRASADLLGEGILGVLRLNERPQWAQSAFRAAIGAGVFAEF